MKADLLLVLHFHQPVGNFDSVFRKVYNNCYKPFLDTISQYPKIKWNLHFSGSLLEWFESNAPEVLENIRVLVEREQVELVGGAMYEPILSVIPEKDRISQIDLMRCYIDSLFNTVAKGAWIPERVWEPHLVSSLAKAGIEYIILDDTHLIYAGIRKEDTYGYYATEDNGSVVRVFPSDTALRYTIPFREPDETFSYMRDVAKKTTGAIFTYGDDVEKFGEWPGTYKLVYEDKWLVKFLEGLSKNRDWLTTTTLSECIKNKKPLGSVYIPTASYQEMLKWARGFFRNFFVKYYEANQMHKRMLYVSNLLSRLKANNSIGKKLKEAYRELYRGGCNCVYWHGLFGGLYLYHLRRATYEHLLKAEKIYSEITKSAEKPKYEIMDFDADGFDEVILQNKNIWLCVKPSSSGSVVEFDLKKQNFNLLNVLTRYKEFYHEAKLPYDRYRRAMLADHFFGKGVTLHDFEKGDYEEKGDFINSPYGFKVAKDKNRLIMKRKGSAYGKDIILIKELILNDSGLNVIYSITNLDTSKRQFHFGTEIPFIMPDADSSRYAYVVDDARDNISSRGEIDRLNSIEFTDTQGDLVISLDFSRECALWRFPIITVSRCEKGYEENYQGSVIVPNWHFALPPNETFRIKFDLNIEISPVPRDSSKRKKEALIQL